MEFEIPGKTALELNCSRLAVVGYAGRNVAEVKAHIAELAQHGVPVPKEIPAVWDVPPESLSQATAIDARASGTSGEVEPVLLFHSSGVYVTVGSDHTDRELERTSMERAKAAFPKVVARQCWLLASVRSVWDQLELRSDIEIDGVWHRYQEGTLAQLLPLEWFVERFSDRVDTVAFCGTVSTLGGMETAATAFRISLRNPTNSQEIVWQYRIGSS